MVIFCWFCQDSSPAAIGLDLAAIHLGVSEAPNVCSVHAGTSAKIHLHQAHAFCVVGSRAVQVAVLLGQ